MTGALARSLAEPALEARGIVKIYEGTRALGGVDLKVGAGTVHGLVGKNGAGKSTLMKILSGAERPDAGEIVIAGRRLGNLTPIEARRAGIAVVHQNPELHLNLTIAANLYLAEEKRGAFGLIDQKAMNRDAEVLLGRLGLVLPASATLGDLDVADRQLVAICKAVHARARVLLLDEATAALNKSQTEFLFNLVRSLAADGLGIIYVSHHLDEVLDISNEVTVLRNGRSVALVDAGHVRKDDLIELMVGRRVATPPAAPRRPVERKPLLALSEVSVPGKLDGATLSVGEGEIVGLVSRTGGGAGALIRVVGGVLAASGRITIVGKPFAPRSIRAAVRAGVVFIPEDMRGSGLVMPMSAAGNMTLARLAALRHGGLIDLAAETEAARATGARLMLTPPDPARRVAILSGGNQRKVLIGRAILTKARILALEEPTQGVDVEARQQIHDTIRQLSEAGTTTLFSSSDPEELIELSERILVLAGGRIVAEVSPETISAEALLLAVQTDGASLKENRRE